MFSFDGVTSLQSAGPALAAWLFGAVLILVFLVHQVRVWRDEIPGPPPLWLLGNLLDLGRKGYHVCQLEWMERYGPLYRYYMGLQRVVVVCDPAIIREITIRQFKSFHDRPMPPYLPPESTRGILFSRGAYWAGVRSALTPMFHSRCLRAYLVAMGAAMVKLQEKLSKLRDGEVVDMQAWSEAMSLDIMGEVAFGEDFGMQCGGPQASAFARAYAENERASAGLGLATLAVLLCPRLRPLVHSLLPRLPFLPEHPIRQRQLYLLRECQALIARRRREGEREPMAARHGDLLSRLTRARLRGSEEGLRASDFPMLAFGLLGAGSSTTATTLACALHLLAGHPPAQRRLLAEVDGFHQRLCGGDSCPGVAAGGEGDGSGAAGGEQERGERPTLEELGSHFRFAEQVVLETLRLYPTGAMIAREANEDVRVGGHFFRRGTPILIPIYALHRDPTLYPDPLSFRPERFDAEGAEAKARPAGAYVPFGLGPRMCIGHRFAMQEVMLALIQLHRRFTFSMWDGAPRELTLNAGLNLKPKHGVPLAVHSRPGKT